ncbi:conserved exported protein of unknown function [Thermococcus nautili]|uniref:hypothetical protein n=1 Tax=Thermococcus nautili TaxID=195522 RepID=UPI002556F8DF|nr:hypothetical protein [Thermococcus nautili]CAI1492668.1 conserved exported protein of unknown function [Thermococcus nautili]
MNWRKTTFGVVLVFMVLSLQLIAAPQAMAMSTNNASVTFRRAVVAWYDDKGKLQMNVTWVNATLNLTNLTHSPCACQNASSCGAFNVSAHLNVSITTLYNMTRKHEQLLFIKVTVYNATFNYTIYNLVYRAERSQYNFTLITKILTDPKTGKYTVFVTGMNIAPDDKNRAVPVGDTVLVLGNLTLSDYYWTLNKVLMKLRRGDETSWIWDRSAYELRHLSHLVRLKLPEYNGKTNLGYAIVIDDYSGCSHLCDLACTSAFTIVCLGAMVSSGGWLGWACFLGGAFCTAGCTALCSSDWGWNTLISGGVSGGCSYVCSELIIKEGACGRLLCKIPFPGCISGCAAVLTPIFCPQICAAFSALLP